jgi:hypothetical protein
LFNIATINDIKYEIIKFHFDIGGWAMRALSRLCWMCGITLLALAGCATRNSVLGDTGELKPEGGTGYVAATLVYRIDSVDPTLQLVGFPSIDSAFYAQGATDKPAFSINTYTDMNNTGLWAVPGAALEESRGRRVMSLVKVPAGRYRLGRVGSQFPAYRQHVTLDMVDPPMIEVREGQVTYAGSIQLVVGAGKNIFGQARPSNAKLRLVDDAARDIAAIKKADARLSQLTVVDGLQSQGHRLAQSAATKEEAEAAPAAGSAGGTIAAAQGPQAQGLQKWDGWMSCGTRSGLGGNNDAFRVNWTLDIDGGRASSSRDNAEVSESLAGVVDAGRLELRGKGQRNADASRKWQYRFSGDLPPGAGSYVGKGGMTADGKQIRSCELHLQRI